MGRPFDLLRLPEIRGRSTYLRPTARQKMQAFPRLPRRGSPPCSEQRCDARLEVGWIEVPVPLDDLDLYREA
ncbi:MAG TPA: hypothetical protein VIL38_06225, partial [Thermaerobacter sp.]